MKDSIKEGNILVMKQLYEAFNFFYYGNRNIELLATKPSVAKTHYVKTEIGYKFMYNCRKYGIKFINIADNVYACEVTCYHVKDKNLIVDSKMNFRYDFTIDELISIDYLYTPYSTLTNNESIKVLYK